MHISGPSGEHALILFRAGFYRFRMAEKAIEHLASKPGTAELLRAAHDLAAEEFGLDHPMLLAAQHLINCAVDVIISLPKGDLESAREALGCARAATGIAGYVVCRMDDEVRSGARR
jgi:hypothetical protein